MSDLAAIIAEVKRHGGPDYALALVAEVERLTRERDEALEQLAAIHGAAEELAHWPEMAETPFLVWAPGQERPTALRPEQVRGIYEGWLAHVERLGTYGKQVVTEWHGLRAEVERLRQTVTDARGLLAEWDIAGTFDNRAVAAKRLQVKAWLERTTT